jgi:hypothetical protein
MTVSDHVQRTLKSLASFSVNDGVIDLVRLQNRP